jgi:hypothetical protein
MFLLQVTSNSPYFSSTNINYTVPYLSLSLALNIIITLVIVLRLLTYRHRISKVLGSNYGTQYTSIAAMIVESAALYSAFSVVFLTLFLLNNPISATFLQSFTQVQVSTRKQRGIRAAYDMPQIIAMLLIVFRVAQGKGWSQDTMSRVMILKPSVQAIRMGDIGYGLRDGSKTFTSSSGLGAHGTYKSSDRDSAEALAAV